MKYLVMALGAAVLLPGLAYGQASRPATDRTVGPEAVRGRWTLVFELEEHGFRAQEMWDLDNPTDGRVPKARLRFPVDPEASRLALDESGSEGFAAGPEGTSVVATRDLAPGRASFAGAYQVPTEDGRYLLERRLPVGLSGGRVIFQSFEGLSVEGLDAMQVRRRKLNGLEFVIYDLGAMPAGTMIDARISGIPTRSTLPRTIAVVLAAGAFVWMLVGLSQRRPVRRSVMGVLSAEARRDQLVRALQLLEEDRSAGRLDDRKYRRRRDGLMKELSGVLEEIELTEGPSTEARSQA